jgi:hypothetical protein
MFNVRLGKIKILNGLAQLFIDIFQYYPLKFTNETDIFFFINCSANLIGNHSRKGKYLLLFFDEWG